MKKLLNWINRSKKSDEKSTVETGSGFESRSHTVSKPMTDSWANTISEYLEIPQSKIATINLLHSYSYSDPVKKSIIELAEQGQLEKLSLVEDSKNRLDSLFVCRVVLKDNKKLIVVLNEPNELYANSFIEKIVELSA